ncbi:hypothetical protein DFH28DRAFT_523695 [Melampsora americana]|nr:hypothetical protein DFH28DRAFT_523695 [Melampsora americana]
MPPYAVAFIFMLFTAFISDRYASRGMSVILSATMLMCGFMMCMVFEEKYQQYGMLYIEIPGAFALVPALGAWLANNSEPYARCASSIAMGFMFSNGGTILTIWLVHLFKSPAYHTMTPIYIGISIGIMLLATFAWAWLAYQNRRKTRNRDLILAPYQARKFSVDAGKGPSQILFLIGWERLGDRHPDFTYSY